MKNTTPRTFRTNYPVNPNCDGCDALLTGSQVAPAVTVAYPTKNPKRAKQVSYCESCSPYTPKF